MLDHTLIRVLPDVHFVDIPRAYLCLLGQITPLIAVDPNGWPILSNLHVLLVQLVQNPALIGASATRVQPEQPLSVV